MSNANRIDTNKGLINDIEKNLLKICQQTFHEDDFAQFSKYRPVVYETGDPIKSNIEDLPALYTWFDSFNVNTNSAGGNSGRALGHQFDALCYVGYILDFVLIEEAEEELKEIGWYLLNMVLENMNLNGIANGGGELVHFKVKPEVLLKGGKLGPVSMVEIVVNYHLTKRQKRARR